MDEESQHFYVEDPQITFTRNLNRIMRLYCQRNNISSKEFYRRMAASGLINTMTFDYYLRGQRWPMPQKLQGLCEFLGVPVEMLFRR